jgi:predicted AAA+ superfamily ATPase
LNENLNPKKILHRNRQPYLCAFRFRRHFKSLSAIIESRKLKWVLCFYDEIQYLKDWERHLKVLVDSYPETKFIDAAAKRLKRITSFKVYVTNTSLRTSLFSPISETDSEMGNMVETAVLSQWMHREKLDLTYARWKDGRKEGELDLVLVDDKKYKPVWGVEIKWSNRYYEKPNELKSLIHFCKSNQLQKALVTTIDQIGTKQIEGLNFSYLPASIYS